MITEIANGFDVSRAPSDDQLNAIPVVVWKYGSQQDMDVKEVQWMTYVYERSKTTNEHGIPYGSIGFIRNAALAFPHFVDYVRGFLLGLGVDTPKNNINLMRTVGPIQPHVDEIRKACINIGLRGCENSVTRMSTGDRESRSPFIDFVSHNETVVIRPGSAYLLDVTRVHSVEPYVNHMMSTRLLISVSLDCSAEDFINRLQHTKEQSSETK